MARASFQAVVRPILVSDGQLIRAGQPLVELDQTQNLADRRRIETELDFVRRKQTRREIIAEWLKRPEDFASTLARAEELAGSDGQGQCIKITLFCGGYYKNASFLRRFFGSAFPE
ncbi:MAG: HlyD family secretion protein [Planctomycetota bacterium]|jgi:multidrug efflux pump subunit AcrA (membrane-fusion protein)|nr:HlyD family secretion protein [Planctomycetota bacterium]